MVVLNTYYLLEERHSGKLVINAFTTSVVINEDGNV